MTVELSVFEVIVVAGLYEMYLKSIKNMGLVSKEEIQKVEDTVDPIIAKMYSCFSEEDEREFETYALKNLKNRNN